MRARRTSLLLLVVLGLGVGACGDDGPDRERLAEDLIAETDGALDEEQAACVAEGLDASFGDDAYETLLRAAADDDTPDADVDAEALADVRVEVIDIFAGCDALGAAVLDEP